MKEYPIIFSTEMVKAILDGRKTQTRRIVAEMYMDYIDAEMNMPTYCPYGTAGNDLWVRETFSRLVPNHIKIGKQWAYKADYTGNYGDLKWKPSIHMPRSAARIFLTITDVRVERLNMISEADAINEGVEPMNSADIGTNHPAWKDYSGVAKFCTTASGSFRSLWDSINGNRSSWKSNPWVWVILFETKRSS